MACALPPRAGTLQLDGHDPWALPRRELQRLRGRLFLAPQVPPLPPRQRVVTAVLAGRLPAMGLLASLRSLFYPQRHSGRARRAASASTWPTSCSSASTACPAASASASAWRARCWRRPRLWLVDEPLSALDPTRAQQALATLVQQARERGVTLVATLHQVDVALAHFPRIVGLRDGALAFDLPAAEVDRDRLARLYAQHEHELHADAPPPPDEPAPQPRAPVVMHCR